jgi:UDP-2,4-diacetamido-2,4,6-trideoxy-beta-L-altropyranose hydrolase
VVDHYQRDVRLESALRPWARRIVVIDDLVDRHHDCDFLLDPSLSRAADDYATMLPSHARLMIGPEFALLRPDFAAARAKHVPRLRTPRRFRILVMFGATDHGGQSIGVVSALAKSGLPIEVEVVTGPAASSLPELEWLAVQSPVPIELSVGAPDIAQRMAAADIAIGGAGTSSWERCCLGLPSVVVVLAENQRQIARGLVCHGAAVVLGTASHVGGEQIADAVRDLLAHGDRLQAMSRSAAALCDGLGAVRVVDAITLQGN